MRWKGWKIAAVAALLAASHGAAEGAAVRITSELEGSEIVVRGARGAQTGWAPLLIEDVEPGVYEMRLFRSGRFLGSQHLEVTDRLTMRSRRGSRTVLSGLFPGLGQWRDYGWTDAWIPLGSVGTSVGRALYFQSRASEAEQEALAWELDGMSRIEADTTIPVEERDAYFEAGRLDRLDDQWLEEQTRNDYAALGLAIHFGNILEAGVRRGAFRFDLSSGNSVSIRHAPTSRRSAVFLSAIRPGLGQLRAGDTGRSRLWQIASTIYGVSLVEAQRKLDSRRIVLTKASRATGLRPDDPGTLARRAAAAGDVEGAKSLRDGLIVGGVALWLLNLADAWFVASPEPMPTSPVQVGERSGPRFDVGVVGEGPGLIVRMGF